MEIKKEQVISITLKGDDAKHFDAALGKIAKGDTKIGFSKEALTEPEQKIIKDLYNKL